MSKSFTAAAAVAVLVFSSAAMSAEKGVWQRMADGATITVEEVRANSDRAFDAIDADGDDVITRQEFVSYPLPDRLGGYANQPDLRADLYQRIDLDSDGRVEAEEWREAIQEDVSMADLNDDGTVTLHELANVDLGAVVMDFFD